MPKEEHHIYFSSSYSTPHPYSGGFTVHLPSVLDLDGNWKCAVLDFFISPDNTNHQPPHFIYILVDFCQTSIISETDRKPILKKVHLSGGAQQYEFSNPLYISLKQNRLIDFDITFLDSFLLPIHIQKTDKIECTLHLIKDE
jgi:hypothetical protein